MSTNADDFFGVGKNAIVDYNTTLNEFLGSYDLASNPETRTGPLIKAKQISKQKILKATRSPVNEIQAWPQMTDDERRMLGITVRAAKPTSTPRPTIKPYLEVESVDQNTVTVRILQSKIERARPKGVAGAILYSAVAPTPPTTESGWFNQGLCIKNTTQVQFPDTVPPGGAAFGKAA